MHLCGPGCLVGAFGAVCNRCVALVTKLNGILAIDQATVSGWAFCEPGEPPLWGHKRMGRAGATEGEVFFAFRLFLMARIDEFRPKYLVMEAPFVPRPDRSPMAKALNPAVLRRAYGLAAQITSIAEEYGLCCYEKQSVEVAKFFTGKGRFPGDTSDERTRAKKQAVMAACWARGWKCTHDEADALALLCCFEVQLYPTYERKIA